MPVPFKDTYQKVFRKVFEVSLAPITGEKWCRDNYWLPPEAGSSRIRYRGTGYQRVLMDILCAENMPYEQITVIKAARIGWSAVLIGMFMYQLAKARRNILFLLPTELFAKKFTKKVLDPSFLDCEATAAAVEDSYRKKDRRQRDTFTEKQVGGKTLTIQGGNASISYKSLTVDTVVFDEMDSFKEEISQHGKDDSEGSPVDLAYTRVQNSTRGRMIVLGGTPVGRKNSILHREYMNAGAVFKYYVPCPNTECGKLHTLEWENMLPTIPDPDGTGRDEVARARATKHRCPNCKHEAEWTQLEWMLDRGRWQVPEAREKEEEVYAGYYIQADPDGVKSPAFMSPKGVEETFPISIGFQIWTGYSTLSQWEFFVRKYLKAKKSVEGMKAFYNEQLGRPYDEGALDITEAQLRASRQKIKRLPNDYKAIIATVDVQEGKQNKEGWLSMLITAWAEDERVILVERIEFHGDTSVPDGSAWNQLYKWLLEKPSWRMKNGDRYPLASIGVDSGHFAECVYRACSIIGGILEDDSKVWALKGASLYNAPVAVNKPKDSPTSKAYNMEFYFVGTQDAKKTLFDRIHKGGIVKLAKTLPEAVDRELAAERLVERTRGGVVVDVYEAGKRRNEALDCLVYALAVFRLRNPNFDVVEEEPQEKKQKKKKHVKVNSPIVVEEPEDEEEYEDEGVYEIEW